jgi:trehalose 6-phosphate phosphatase
VSGTALELENQHCFFREVAAAEKRVLLLDYDGTIAPFCSDRQRAFPWSGVTELVRRISTSCRTRLIVITGRPAHEIVPLLGLAPSPEIWGTYGLERLYGDAARWCCRYDETEISDEAAQALADAEIRLDSAGLRDRIEIKLAGVAVHWRGLEPSEILKRTKAYRILEPLGRQKDLVMADFEEGVELRLRLACKGNAVRSLLADLDPGVPVAYLGDDATDEDAFRALNDRGFTVLVRPKHKFTSAQTWLRPPDELIGFLKDWMRACGEDR